MPGLFYFYFFFVLFSFHRRGKLNFIPVRRSFYRGLIFFLKGGLSPGHPHGVSVFDHASSNPLQVRNNRKDEPTCPHRDELGRSIATTKYQRNGPYRSDSSIVKSRIATRSSMLLCRKKQNVLRFAGVSLDATVRSPPRRIEVAGSTSFTLRKLRHVDGH